MVVMPVEHKIKKTLDEIELCRGKLAEAQAAVSHFGTLLHQLEGRLGAWQELQRETEAIAASAAVPLAAAAPAATVAPEKPAPVSAADEAAVAALPAQSTAT